MLAQVRRRTVDRQFLDQARLDVRERTRTSAFPWRGQFTPRLVEVILEAYGPAERVLDPFAGTGTVLSECVRRGIPSAAGDINPAAVHLASVFKLASLHPPERQAIIKEASIVVSAVAGPVLSGLSGSESQNSYTADLVRKVHEADNPYVSDLLAAVLLLALGDAMDATPLDIQRAKYQVFGALRDLPATRVPCDAWVADARELPAPDHHFDLILTSPPYINVFNYHQNYRPGAEMLGWNVLEAARTEIGANRKYRGNRFLTVIQYALDMAAALTEMRRVCVPGGRLVLVVGRESKVRGVPFNNGELVSSLAESVGGWRFVRWHERKFTNRFGTRIFEEVLIFEASAVSGITGQVDDRSARELIKVLLEEAVVRAPSDTHDDLAGALSRVDEIPASPRLAAAREPLLIA